jgi:hypothetical protein
MTTTRYRNKMDFVDVILMGSNEWTNFKKSLAIGCTFKVRRTDYSHAICRFSARYYYSADGVTMNFHITNDDRRRIMQFLKTTHEIT